MNEIDRPNETPGQEDDSFANKLRQRAYELWEEEGRPDGKDQEFWYRAEQESHAAHPTASTGSQASDDMPTVTPDRSGNDDILPS